MPPRQNPLWGLLRETPNTDIGGEWMHFYYRPQRSWVKVMFLQASVILSTGGGLRQGNPPPLARRPPRQGDTPLGADPPRSRPPPGTRPPREADSSIRSTSGRYASYWNAFLFFTVFTGNTTSVVLVSVIY